MVPAKFKSWLDSAIIVKNKLLLLISLNLMVLLLSERGFGNAILTKEEIAEKISNTVSNIYSVEYMYEEGKLGDQNFTSLLWKETDEKHYYHYQARTGDRVRFNQISGFDGEIGFQLRLTTKQMLVSKKNFGHDIVDRYANPLMVFDFLNKGVSRIKLRDIRDAKINFGESISNIRTQRKFNRDCLVFDVLDVYDRDLDIPTSYTVYLSINENYFPVAWTSSDQQGELLKNLEVAEIQEHAFKNDSGTSDKAFFPLRIKYWRGKFKGEIKPILRGLPTWITPEMLKFPGMTRVYVFDHLALNSCSDDSFVLDPTMADSIHDLDTDKLIMVPK